METGRAIDGIEVGADELAVLHADAVVIDQIGHPTRRVDLVVGTADGACLGLENGNAIGELFLQYEDAGKPGIGRSIGDVELHGGRFSTLLGGRNGSSTRDQRLADHSGGLPPVVTSAPSRVG